MSSLGEDFPKEQERVRELLSQYRAIGPAGAFGAMMIQMTLRKADQAASSGDVIAMIQAYEEMKQCE